MLKTTLYIGSNNKTHRHTLTDIRKIRAWGEKYCPDGHTLISGHGSYNGVGEDTILLIAISETPISLGHILELKLRLRQECIMVTQEEVVVRFV